MKRFEFRLDRVRRWRAGQASLEELKLQRLQAELEELAAAKRQAKSDFTRSEQQVLGQPSIDPIEFTSLDSYRFYTRGRIQQVEMLGRSCEAKIVAQRQRVIEARRQFELLDHLYRAALGKWNAAANKEQEDLAAELYLAKRVRSGL